MFVSIIQVFPLQSRDYTDRMGAAQKFYSKGLLVNCSDGTIYLEAVQEVAQEIEKMELKPKDCALVQIGCVARMYKDSKGQDRLSNELTIKRLVIV